jgi:hypothetical protein
MTNIAMEKPPILIGKPSISMGHLYHGYVSHNHIDLPSMTISSGKHDHETWDFRNNRFSDKPKYPPMTDVWFYSNCMFLRYEIPRNP